jgi:hypothetical protein
VNAFTDMAAKREPIKYLESIMVEKGNSVAID